MYSAERKKGSETKTEAERLKNGEGGCMDMGSVAVILRGTEQSVWKPARVRLCSIVLKLLLQQICILDHAQKDKLAKCELGDRFSFPGFECLKTWTTVDKIVTVKSKKCHGIDFLKDKQAVSDKC